LYVLLIPPMHATCPTHFIFLDFVTLILFVKHTQSSLAFCYILTLRSKCFPQRCSQTSSTYEGVSKSFQTGFLEWELQMVQLSATICICIAILWVSLVSFAAITLCIASQVLIVVYFVMIQSRNFWIPPCIFFPAA
jgi:hypothetical protein